MYTLSYLYGVGPLIKDSVIIQAWQEGEGELKLTNSEVGELWNEREGCHKTKHSPFSVHQSTQIPGAHFVLTSQM